MSRATIAVVRTFAALAPLAVVALVACSSTSGNRGTLLGPNDAGTTPSDAASTDATVGDAHVALDSAAPPIDAGVDAPDTGVLLPADGGAFALPAGDYVVSPDGDDTNDGMTLATPFKTISQCASVVTAGQTCFLRAGTYREAVRPTHGGMMGMPIVFQSVPGEAVFVSGADLVTSTWTVATGSIYETTIAIDPMRLLPANQVFVDGAMVPEARWPNAAADPLDGTTEATAQAGTTAASIVDSNIPGDAGTWNGATIHLRGGYDYARESATVATQTAGTLNLSLAYSDADLNATQGSRYFLTGNVAALDSAGEWFYDGTTLSLWSPDGASPASHVVEVKQRTYGFDLDGLSYVNLLGINVVAATISTTSASNLDLGSLRVLYPSHYTAFSGDPHTVHQLDTGVILAGTSNTLHDSEIAFSAGNGVSVQGSTNTVTNNLIHDTDYAGVYNAPVFVSGTAHTISYNTAYRTGRDGILFGGAASVTNSDVSYNDVFCYGALNQDEGAIYGLSINFSGTEIHHNWLHDIVAIDNRGFGGAADAGPAYTGVGVYLDDSSTNATVDHNVSWNNVGSAFRFDGPSNTGHVLDSNTAGDGQNASFGGVDTASGTFEVIDNIFLAPILTPDQAPGTRAKNAQPSEAQAVLYFVSLSGNNYELSATSPAIGAGEVVPGITSDAGPIDQGAYQHADTWRPGCTHGECTSVTSAVCGR